MELMPATEDQIAIFKKSAAARYAELGVPPEAADRLFNLEMAKTASALGIEDDKEAACSAHKAKKKPAPKKMKKKSERIEKIAAELASSLGLERKA